MRLFKGLKSEYAKNASILMIGTTVGMIIQTIAQPILIGFGFYDDAELGARALFTSFYSVLVIIATLRFEMAVMLPKTEKEAYNVTVLSCFTSIVFAVILGILVFGIRFVPNAPVTPKNIDFVGQIGYYLWNFVSSLKAHNWLWMTPVITAELGIYNSCNYWLNRNKRYKNLAFNRVLQQVLIVAVSIVFSRKVFDVGINGMVIAYTVAQGAVMVLLIYYVLKDKKRLEVKFNLSELKRIFVKYKDFPANLMPSGLVNQIAVQLPVWILTAAFGGAVCGQYSMTLTVLGTPITVIGQSVADVFRQKGSADYNENGNCKEIYVSTAKALSKLAIIPFVLIAALSLPVFRMLFGMKWDMAAFFIIIMTPFYFIRFIVSPLTYMTIIAEKQRFELLWQISMAVFTGLSLIVTGMIFNLSPYIAIAAYSVAYSIMYGVHMMYTYRLASGKIKENKRSN